MMKYRFTPLAWFLGIVYGVIALAMTGCIIRDLIQDGGLRQPGWMIGITLFEYAVVAYCIWTIRSERR